MKTKRKILLSHLTWQSMYFRYAWRLTIACLLTVVLYTFLNIKNGYWVVFSVIACIWPTLGISLQRIRQRLLGTFFGIALGIIIAHSFLGVGIYIDILLPLFIFLMFYLKAYNYSFYVLFVTVVTMLFVCLLDPGNWQIALVRLEMTVAGVVIAFLSTLYLFPVQTSQRMPLHLQQARDSLKQYFAALCALYRTQEGNAATLQLQTFKQLQVTLVAAEESTLELTQVKMLAEHEHEIARIRRVYEELLILDIHLPSLKVEESLQHVLVPLGTAMEQMLSLFDAPNEVQCFGINRQLAEFKTNINAQRTRLARDPTIKAALLHDHIQLTLFVEALQALLVQL